MHQDTFEIGNLPAVARAHPAGFGWRLRAAVTAVDRTLAVWHYRARSRHELGRLEPWILRDAGLDPIAVLKEANKPFWRP